MINLRISIKIDQEYRTSIEEKASQAGLTISAYIRHCLDNVGPKSDQSPNKIGPKSYTNKLM